MRIEYDPAKDVTNRTKHGVSLALASELDWEAALVWIDSRFEYGELRVIALAPKTENREPKTENREPRPSTT
jgi:uncharacterized DUF497 family protein